MLTAEQRYRQAIMKAKIVARRNIRAMMRGDRPDSGMCGVDLERKFIIQQIEAAAQSSFAGRF